MTAGPGASETRIVVGVDGSLPSREALRWAAHFATIFGARLEAVIAWEYPASYGWAGLAPEWDPAQDMREVLNDTMRAVFGDQPPRGVQLLVREGGAAKVLLEACKGAVMLVVGSRGHGGFSGLLLGSVSANVAEHAPCPVFIVHGGQLPPPAPAGADPYAAAAAPAGSCGLVAACRPGPGSVAAVAEPGFGGLDLDEPVVFCDPLAASRSAGFQLAAAGADGQVGDERVFGLAGAMGDELPVPGPAAYGHRRQRLGDGADLVELDQRRVRDAPLDGAGDDGRVGAEVVVTDQFQPRRPGGWSARSSRRRHPRRGRPR